MIAFFTVIYCLCIWLFFSKMKIKPTPTNVAVAVVVGVIAIGMIVIFWRFSAPSSSNLVVARYSVQIVPQVKGPITKIHAEPNVPLEKGKDILFEIQKDQYQFTFNQIAASLRAAEKTVQQNQAGIIAAAAAVRESEANLAASKAELDVALEIERGDAAAISKLKVVQLSEQYKASFAAVEQAKASEQQADYALQAAEDNAVSLQAQLESAEFDLEQCTVYAPADGFVTNWAVREGTMAVSLPFAPVGTFVDTSRTIILASFSQNVLRNVKSGDAVEVSLKTRPGEFFSGTVDSVIRATGDGQPTVSGSLPSAEDLDSSGQLFVRFKLDDEELDKSLTMGTAGTVVIYTDTGKPFHIISKVVVRMNAWMYYLNPF